jgi:predicted nuclease of predicted toxin-antitoxin system
MKFLVDMPLSPKTVSHLMGIGYKAVRVNELGMGKSKDKEIVTIQPFSHFTQLI